ncbi:hypothetical protein Nepgr_001948, partial [Nepenthes gracilis]
CNKTYSFNPGKIYILPRRELRPDARPLTPVVMVQQLLSRSFLFLFHQNGTYGFRICLNWPKEPITIWAEQKQKLKKNMHADGFEPLAFIGFSRWTINIMVLFSQELAAAFGDVMSNVLQTSERFTVPVTSAEFAVMRTAFSFALPRIMGWDQYTNQLP